MPRRYRDSKVARKRQRYERKKIHSQQKHYLRELRYDERRKFWLKLAAFFANPAEVVRPSTREAQNARARRRHFRHERMLKLADFLRNPFKVIFRPHPLQEERKRIMYLEKVRHREERQLARDETKHALKEIRSSGDLRMSIFREFAQSTAWYVLAALIIYIIYQSVTITVAHAYDIPVIWRYNRLVFPLYTWSPLYTRQALVVIFAAGPVIVLLLALFALRLFFLKRRSKSRFNLFFLWMFIHGINMFFGAYIAGILTRTEFVYASEWLFMSNPGDIEEIIFGILSIAALIITGRQSVLMFLLSSGSITLVKPRYRLFFVISFIILPWVAGIVLFFVITLPHYYIPLILKTLTPGMIVLPTLIRYNSIEYETLHESGLIRRRSFRWGVVIFVIALLFFYRLILNWGIEF
jgi:hypothetical protein